MFRMLGPKVELIRYKIVYSDEDGALVTENCVSEDHKNEIEQALTSKGTAFTTAAVDQTGNEWISGLTFDSCDAAREALVAGEQAYAEKMSVKTSTESMQLRADLDYLAILAGVEL